MIKHYLFVNLLILGTSVLFAQNKPAAPKPASTPDFRIMSEADWRARLTPSQYRILREKGTERAFTGKYVDNHDKGLYRCAGCGQELFDSVTKYESGSGWPSFYQPVRASAVKIIADNSHGMVREEVTCSRCGGHLGHVFNDGPRPTGLRYCLNSESLAFEKLKKP